MKLLFLSLILSIFFTNCVTSTIEIHNNTDNNASFCLKSSLITKELIIIKPNEEAIFLYQFGANFSDSNLEYLVSNIGYIELQNKNTSLFLDDKEEIFAYLKKRRRGVFKNKIVIYVK